MGGPQAHGNSKAKNPGRGDAPWNREAIVSPHFAANLPFSEAILSGWHSLNAVESAGSRYDSAGSNPVGDAKLHERVEKIAISLHQQLVAWFKEEGFQGEHQTL